MGEEKMGVEKRRRKKKEECEAEGGEEGSERKSAKC